MKKRMLPIGIQDFRDLREKDMVYVDKTEHIHRLITEGSYYFFSRPRRFGKSLTVSTLKEIFSGSKELFKGLWIEDNWDWSKTSPVIHLSFARMDYQTTGLDKAISHALNKIATAYDVQLSDSSFKVQFEELIEKLDAKHGKIVLLIDEYDKPIIDYLENHVIDKAKEHQRIMKTFYSVLKDAGSHLRMVFITGVSKFSKVSIFSDLNHLDDITIDGRFVNLVGYTQNELETNFKSYIDEIAVTLNTPKPELLDLMRKWYNGFSWDGVNKVYNPFGTLNFLQKQAFQNFWFTTGTPTFLAELMKKQANFEFDNTAVTSVTLEKYDLDNLNLVPLLFQTGYLTIKEKDLMTGDMVLDYPNKEVRESMYQFLLDYLSNSPVENSSGNSVKHLAKAFHANDLDRVKLILDTLFADLSYNLYEPDPRRSERFYHSVIHLMFKYLGVHVQSEVHTSLGRADSVVETGTHIYVFEFKYNKSGKTAFDQIIKNGYADKYRASGKNVMGIGVNFSEKKKTITGWVVKDLLNND
jgi:hypothetical protein